MFARSYFGNIIQHKDDWQHGDYPLKADIFKIAPSNNYLVTSSSGAVYSADVSMNYIGSLPCGSDSFSDVEFSSGGNIIYAGVKTMRAIYMFDYESLN
ncbi:hypothetical protein [Marinilabilia salmonicolor]|uniref:hypothetical protein n=1 Tax=Marinilabilia salmonicolor TaxID=989 RepID=UPI00029A55E1|nr:hypothetical protein [Marinilabilia salmonicolor]